MADPRAIEAARRAFIKRIGNTRGQWVLHSLDEEALDDAIAAYLAAQPQETPVQKGGEWERVGTTVRFPGGGFDVRNCPKPEALADLIVRSINRAAAPQKAMPYPPDSGLQEQKLPADETSDLYATVRDHFLGGEKPIPDAEGLIKELRDSAERLANLDLVDDDTEVIAKARWQAAAVEQDAAEALTAANERAEKAEREAKGEGWAEFNRVREWLGKLIGDSYRERSMWARLARVELWYADMKAARDKAEAQVETIKAETVDEAIARLEKMKPTGGRAWTEDQALAYAVLHDAQEAIRALSPATAPMTKGE